MWYAAAILAIKINLILLGRNGTSLRSFLVWKNMRKLRNG
jgi:hypothetical protein